MLPFAADGSRSRSSRGPCAGRDRLNQQRRSQRRHGRRKREGRRRLRWAWPTRASAGVLGAPRGRPTSGGTTTRIWGCAVLTSLSRCPRRLVMCGSEGRRDRAARCLPVGRRFSGSGSRPIRTTGRAREAGGRREVVAHFRARHQGGTCWAIRGGWQNVCGKSSYLRQHSGVPGSGSGRDNCLVRPLRRGAKPHARRARNPTSGTRHVSLKSRRQRSKCFYGRWRRMKASCTTVCQQTQL